VVGPGEFCELKLTIGGNSYPSIYQGELECKVIWLNRLTAPAEERQRHHANRHNPGNNEGSRSLHTPRSSEVVKLSEKNKDFAKESLFLRIKKKSKLDVPTFNNIR
jgi:hypothetical protein